MCEDRDNRASVRLLYFLMASALLLIAFTLTASMFLRMDFFVVCICKINVLAYSWILLASAVLTSLAGLVINSFCTKTGKWVRILIVLSSLLLMAGVIYLILFACKYLNNL